MTYKINGDTVSPAHDITVPLTFADHIVGVHDEPGPGKILGTGDDVLNVTANNDQIPDIVVHFYISDITLSGSKNTIVACDLVVTYNVDGFTTNEDDIRIVK